jgi:hypothetical protein
LAVRPTAIIEASLGLILEQQAAIERPASPRDLGAEGVVLSGWSASDRQRRHREPRANPHPPISSRALRRIKCASASVWKTPREAEPATRAADDIHKDPIDLDDIQQVRYALDMARMGRPVADTSQVTVRVPNDYVKRAKALADLLSGKGYSSDRASILRAAIGRGLEVLEVEHRVGAKPKVKG